MLHSKKLFIFLISILCWQNPTLAEESPHSTFNDWVEAPTMPLCHGFYDKPRFLNALPEDTAKISALHSQLVPNGLSKIWGDVTYTQGFWRIFTDKAYIYRQSTTGNITRIRGEGYVMLEQPDSRMLAKSADINIEKQQGKLKDVEFRLYSLHARGKASSVKQQAKKLTTLKNASYTTCAPWQNTWSITAKKLYLNHLTGQGYATGGKIKLYGVPVFYSPIFPFPIGKKRHSGFLTPHYTNTSESGREFMLPFYFNLAPNYDVTLRAHAMEQRRLALDGNWRFLTHHQHGKLYFAGIPFDPKFKHFRQRHLQPTPLIGSSDPRFTSLKAARPRRYAISFYDKITFNPQLSGNLTYHTVSDDEYLVDIVNHPFKDEKRHLKRAAHLHFTSKHWTASSLLQGYQTLQPYDAAVVNAPYQLLPKINIEGDYFFGFNRPHFSLISNFTYFAHEGDPVTNAKLVEGARLHLIPKIALPLRKPYGYFTPTFGVALTQYKLNLSQAAQLNEKPKMPQRILPIFHLDTGLIFDRRFNLFHQNLSQTLEPRLFYAYIPYKSQNNLPNFDSSLNTYTIHQLFTVNRFNSIDRIGDANQLSLAIKTRLNSQKTGEEYFWGQIGQRYYFTPRKVTLCDTRVNPSCRLTEDLLDPKGNTHYTPLTMELGFRLPPYIRARLETQWDTSKNTLKKYAFGVEYWADEHHLLNINYYGQEKEQTLSDVNGERLQQIDTSFIWLLHPNWRLLGRWHYDVKRHFPYHLVAGIEYNTCCWGLRAGAAQVVTINANQHRQYSHQFSLEFVLKGLSGIGIDPASIFRDNIPGYTPYFSVR